MSKFWDDVDASFLRIWKVPNPLTAIKRVSEQKTKELLNKKMNIVDAVLIGSTITFLGIIVALICLQIF